MWDFNKNVQLNQEQRLIKMVVLDFMSSVCACRQKKVRSNSWWNHTVSITQTHTENSIFEVRLKSPHKHMACTNYSSNRAPLDSPLSLPLAFNCHSCMWLLSTIIHACDNVTLLNRINGINMGCWKLCCCHAPLSCLMRSHMFAIVSVNLTLGFLFHQDSMSFLSYSITSSSQFTCLWLNSVQAK